MREAIIDDLRIEMIKPGIEDLLVMFNDLNCDLTAAQLKDLVSEHKVFETAWKKEGSADTKKAKKVNANMRDKPVPTNKFKDLLKGCED